MSLKDTIIQSSEFEHEYEMRRSRIDNIELINSETISLVNFAIKYDRDRYFKKLSHKSIQVETTEELAYIFQGLADFYDAVLRDGLEQWNNESKLKEMWKKIFTLKMLKAIANDKPSALISYGWQLGIIGLMAGCLYYDQTSKTPKISSKMALQKKRYDEIEKNTGKEIVQEVMNNYSFSEVINVIPL